MAAIAIPLIAQAAPLVVPLVVKLIDKLMGHGNGAAKLPAATSVIQAIFASMQKADTSTSLPADAGEIQKLVQGAVDALKDKGELRGPDTVIDAPTTIQIRGNQDLAKLLLKTGVALLDAN